MMWYFVAGFVIRPFFDLALEISRDIYKDYKRERRIAKMRRMVGKSYGTIEDW